jgi:hypothetical protein
MNSNSGRVGEAESVQFTKVTEDWNCYFFTDHRDLRIILRLEQIICENTTKNEYELLVRRLTSCREATEPVQNHLFSKQEAPDLLQYSIKPIARVERWNFYQLFPKRRTLRLKFNASGFQVQGKEIVARGEVQAILDDDSHSENQSTLTISEMTSN